MMRFHVVSEPHTQTARDWSNAAFTDKTRRFCDMMKGLGHHVTLYASEENDAACDELVTCITKAEQLELAGVAGPGDVGNPRAAYQEDLPHWQLMNMRVILAMLDRVQDGDIICTTAGYEQWSVPAAFPGAFSVEHGVGYQGVRHDSYRVFESQAWMHAVYGWAYGSHAVRGRFSDRVIPNFFDPADFPFQAEKDDYFLYMGRLHEDKGVRLAAEVANHVGARLVVAGVGPVVPEGVEFVGRVGPAERAKLLSNARGTFVPTQYLEPFGGIAVESMMSGTPVITTDWGAFTETVNDGVTGYRCNTFQDFVDAANAVRDGAIDPTACHDHAMRYSMATVCWEYQQFFTDIIERR